VVSPRRSRRRNLGPRDAEQRGDAALGQPQQTGERDGFRVLRAHGRERGRRSGLQRQADRRRRQALGVEAAGEGLRGRVIGGRLIACGRAGGSEHAGDHGITRHGPTVPAPPRPRHRPNE
jgi:hypothetical protein